MTRWRRSLQVRVVALTVVLGTVVVLALGQFILFDVADGLVEQRRSFALIESQAQLVYAQEAFDQAPPQNAVAEQQLVDDLLPRLEGSGPQPAAGGRAAAGGGEPADGDPREVQQQPAAQHHHP